MTTYSQTRSNPYGLVLQIFAALFGGAALFVLGAALWVFGYQLWYSGRIFPGVSMAGVDLSGLPVAQASARLEQALTYPQSGKIVLRDGEKVWVATPAELGVGLDAASSAQQAYRLGRSGGLFGSLEDQLQSWQRGVDVSPVLLFDQRVAYAYLQKIAVEIDRPVVEARLEVEGTNVVAEPGQIGRVLNVDATMVYVNAQMQTFRDGEAPLYIEERTPQVLDASAQAETARQILSAPLTLGLPAAAEGDPGPWTVSVETLSKMLVIARLENGPTAGFQVALNAEALRPILDDVAAQVNRVPENARFYFDDETRELVLIQNAKIGRTLDIDGTISIINQGLSQGQHSLALQIITNQPLVPDTATAASLGITELVSSQTSYFYGSSGARIQNITAASARFHGYLVAPGETFSMGEVMGDVSLDSGFAEALIIFGGRTIKGVGGGVCQVSTTLFRTVFFGGYPVEERYAHAYRVSYYEQTYSGGIDPSLAGLDATVYFPLVDFKFTNDSPNWLLMETYVNAGTRTLTWKFYSTSDGRTVEWNTTGPTGIVPAPKPLFRENSELARNEINQVDWEADGADVLVTRTVWRGGSVILQDEFRTHYEPWQAICEYGPGTKDLETRAENKGLCQ